VIEVLEFPQNNRRETHGSVIKQGKSDQIRGIMKVQTLNHTTKKERFSHEEL
jgi:hypothetical protein